MAQYAEIFCVVPLSFYFLTSERQRDTLLSPCGQTAWVQIPVLRPISYVILDRLLNLCP